MNALNSIRHAWPRLGAMILLAATFGLLLALSAAPVSELAPVAAQGGSAGGNNCDGNLCEIYGVGPAIGVVGFNVCNAPPTVRLLAPAGAGGLFPVTVAPFNQNTLLIGDAGGALWTLPITCGGCAPTLAYPGGAPAGHTALTEGGGGSHYAGFGVNLFRVPGAALIGPGIGNYAVGDQVFRHGAGAVGPPPFPMLGSVTIGAIQNLVDVSRGSGLQFNPRPFVPAAAINGLALDGNNGLWGSTGANLHVINPANGANAIVLPFAGLSDLGSTPRCSSAEPPEQADLGDAPDSSNHAAVAMTAYSGITAAFPSVFDATTGSPAGPFHRAVGGDSWLGSTVSQELDADKMPDTDGVTNIDPPTDTNDRDGGDDGVTFPLALPDCQMTQVQYILSVSGQAIDRYVNVWFDFARDGDWGDQLSCIDRETGQPVTVDEWAVQNHVVNQGSGTYLLTTPTFRSLDIGESLWMRVSVAESPAPAADGSGPSEGYEVGESEDYLLQSIGGSQYMP